MKESVGNESEIGRYCNERVQRVPVEYVSDSLSNSYLVWVQVLRECHACTDRCRQTARRATSAKTVNVESNYKLAVNRVV